MIKDEKHFCDFCGKAAKDVPLLIAGPNVDICSVCVDLARDIVGANRVNVNPVVITPRSYFSGDVKKDEQS